MKKPLIAFGFLGLLGSTSALCWTTPSWAGNSNVEVALQSSGDLSMFYQALLNTGVINELNENQKYTIFAPVNTAFVQIPPSAYPCFYAVECRPQIAQVLRDYIVADHYDLADLVTYGQGIQTNGAKRIHVEEPFVNDFAVNNQKILSKTEVNGNVIYRIDGVINTPEEMAQFRTINVVPVADSVTTEKTVIQKTYRSPSDLSPQAYPGGSMDPVNAYGADSQPGGKSTTTIIRTYSTQAQ